LNKNKFAMSNSNTNSAVEWLQEKVIIYILPAAFVLYVDYTKCFPYYFARWLWKGTRYQNSPHVHDGFLYAVCLITFGGFYLVLEKLFKSKYK
jgi:hypothetical protein